MCAQQRRRHCRLDTLQGLGQAAPIIAITSCSQSAPDRGGGIFLADAKVQIPTVATVVNNTIVAKTGSGILWVNIGPAIYNNLVIES